MKNRDTEALVERIKSLLKEERNLIKSGSLWELETLTDSKTNLFESLRDIPSLNEKDLTEIKRLSSHNHELYQAALTGIKQAHNRISDILKSRDGFVTYDQSGSKRTMQNKLPKVHGRI